MLSLKVLKCSVEKRVNSLASKGRTSMEDARGSMVISTGNVEELFNISVS